MSEQAQERTRDSRYRDRRADERFEINVPGGCLNYQGEKYPCQIIDVSLSGCCVRTHSRFLPGNLAHVEVVLPILGMVVRMVGTTQWLTPANLIGIRFFHANSRSKNQLAGLLTGLADASTTQEVQAAVIEAARKGDNALDVEVPETWMYKPRTAPALAIKPTPQEPPTPIHPTPERAEKSDDQRPKVALEKEEDAWPAVLHILKDSSIQNGAIVGLSLQGCSFLAAGAFYAGIHIRVEVDFQMRGLPFLLAGVTTNVRDKSTVDIKFLEMSFRKRQELAELIEELSDAAKKQSGAVV
jgi:hypothetical protein